MIVAGVPDGIAVFFFVVLLVGYLTLAVHVRQARARWNAEQERLSHPCSVCGRRIVRGAP